MGFDSAWTSKNLGGLVAVLERADGTLLELGPPEPASYAGATERIAGWQRDHRPARTLVMLDQPTLVPNAAGQRPVERIVCSPVSARRSGMQPAFTGRAQMFGEHAPVWPFLARFGVGTLGLGVPLSGVVESYPVLALIAWGWLVPRTAGRLRLPKYNPARRATFSLQDWRWVCECAGGLLANYDLPATKRWLAEARSKEHVRKRDQDQLDAVLCLLIGLGYLRGQHCLAVGQQATGWLLAPYSSSLAAELRLRCGVLGLPADDWVHILSGAGEL